MRLVATVHGEGLASIITDNERRDLIGGVVSLQPMPLHHPVLIAAGRTLQSSGVLLSDAVAAQRPDKRKAVEKRRGEPPFQVAIELRGFHDWIVHPRLSAAVRSICWQATDTPQS